MDWLLALVEDNLAYAHWVFFGMLILAGLNFPISEDLVMIASGVIASTVSPAMVGKLFVFVFLGAYLSDWMVYWIGRSLGPSLWKFRWFARTVTPARFKKMEVYYERYGMTTLLIGRFIPFGVRNCLFLTAGIAKMSFPRFIIADGIACLASNSVLFWLAFTLGRHYDEWMGYIDFFHVAVFAAFIIGIVVFFLFRRARKRAKERC
ncbi:MAG: DedA family protein [Verrucomicrobia bacterium]|nr:DedA family protein [Verrucomicrobiota bacterium]